jgi:hypothetical protein
MRTRRAQAPIWVRCELRVWLRVNQSKKRARSLNKGERSSQVRADTSPTLHVDYGATHRLYCANGTECQINLERAIT